MKHAPLPQGRLIEIRLARAVLILGEAELLALLLEDDGRR